MKWLLDVIMKFLAWDDPKLCPIPVRASLALLIIATGAITECHLSLGLPRPFFSRVQYRVGSFGCWHTELGKYRVRSGSTKG